MPRVGWTFTGSRWVDELDEQGKPTGRSRFLPEITGTIVDTWSALEGVLSNPLPERDYDAALTANLSILPEPGTPVKVIIKPPTAQEIAQIRKIEKGLSK
jgi:hypothetical protein